MLDLHNLANAGSAATQPLPSWVKQTPEPPPDPYETAQRCIDVYLLSRRDDGEMGGIGWWQTANGYTAIAIHDANSEHARNYDVLRDSITSCARRQRGLINDFNDDTLWWALCCLHCYQIKADAWFLETAEAIWRHVRASGSIIAKGALNFRDMDMEGGCYWTTRPGERQINSISTGLFAELSVRLAILHAGRPTHPRRKLLTKLLRSKSPDVAEYIAAAKTSLAWILRCRYRPVDALVLDHIDTAKGECVDWTFTYTTGVTLGVCALLFEATQEREYLQLACQMARRSMTRQGWVDEDGVLTEAGAYGRGSHNPVENNDAVGFKAILIRHLAQLYRVCVQSSTKDPEIAQTATMIRAFVALNLCSQRDHNTNGNGQYGPWWHGPFDTPTSHSQMAVLDVMAAAVVVDTTVPEEQH